MQTVTKPQSMSRSSECETRRTRRGQQEDRRGALAEANRTCLPATTVTANYSGGRVRAATVISADRAGLAGSERILGSLCRDRITAQARRREALRRGPGWRKANAAVRLAPSGRNVKFRCRVGPRHRPPGRCLRLGRSGQQSHHTERSFLRLSAARCSRSRHEAASVAKSAAIAENCRK